MLKNPDVFLFSQPLLAVISCCVFKADHKHVPAQATKTKISQENTLFYNRVAVFVATQDSSITFGLGFGFGAGVRFTHHHYHTHAMSNLNAHVKVHLIVHVKVHLIVHLDARPLPLHLPHAKRCSFRRLRVGGGHGEDDQGPGGVGERER